MSFVWLQRYNGMAAMKKSWLFFLMLFFTMIYPHPDAKAEAYLYGEGQSMGIADEQGTILPPEYYIYENTLSFVFCDTNDKWGFYDKASGFLQVAAYDFVYDECVDPEEADPSSPILVGQNHDQIAYLNRSNGEVIIPFQYYYFGLCSEFCNGYAVVMKDEYDPYGDQSPQCILIDEAGNEIMFPDECMPCSFVSNNSVVVYKEYIETRQNIICHYFRHGLGTVDGSILLPPKYDYIAYFHEGYACVKQDGRWGHIDDQGNEIVAPTYELLEEVCGGEGYYFKDGVAELLLMDETVINIDYSGNVVDVPNPRRYIDYY